ncbi:MAG TPA: hypothetical protein VD906_01680 [Caulobacteraceae bacterium]|nr:hypothetical protein [Caulobacteraceae bacterium]
MAAKLKVFVTSNGLVDYVVATTSRVKALEAWGVRQDLFKEGAARETDDPELVKAASAKPGEVLERRVGSAAALKAMKAAAPAKAKGPSKAALKKVADLEARLEALEDRWAGEVEALEKARSELDRREAREQAAYEAERAKLSEQLKKARAAVS